MDRPNFYEGAFENENGGHFTHSWSSEAAAFLRKNRYKHIELSGNWGDLSFLSEFSPFLETITIRNYDPLVSGINALNNLKSLVLWYKAKDSLDFKNFPKLEVCQFSHNKEELKPLYALPNIKHNVVFFFREKSLLSFGKKTTIEKLLLSRPRVETLEGISAAEQLVNLRLDDANHLQDISEIGSLSRLENVLVQTAKKIKDCSPLGKVTSLKKLVLVCTGGLEQTDWISSLVNLEKLAFSGYPVEVDWAKIMALPKLAQVHMLQAKEHAPTDEEIEERALRAGKVITRIVRAGTKKIPLIGVDFSPPLDT